MAISTLGPGIFSQLAPFFPGLDEKEERKRKEKEREEQPLGKVFTGFAMENKGAPTEDLLNEFNKRYRQTTSPAREFLSNLLNSASHALLEGKTAPKSLRERAFEEFIKAKQTQAQEERVQNTLQIAQMNAQQRAEAQAETAQIRRDMARETARHNLAREAAKAGDQKLAEMIYDLKIDQFDAGKPLLEAQVANLKASAEQKKRDLGGDSLEQARTLLAEKGIDSTNEGYFDLLTSTARQFEAVKKAGKSTPRGPLSSTGQQLIQISTPYGERKLLNVNKGTNTAVEILGDGRTQPYSGSTLDTGETTIRGVNAVFDSLTFANGVMQQIISDPSALRSNRQIISELVPIADKYLQLRTPAERTLNNSLKQYLLESRKAVTGLQATDRELFFIENINPSSIDTPLRALSQLVTTSVLKASQQARLITGQSDEVGDFEAVRQLILDNLKALDRAGNISAFKMPSFQALVTEAARARKKTAIFEGGRLRSIQ